MPLSTSGQKAMRNMKKTYGPKKGERVFYATENKNAKFRRAVRRGGGR